VSAKALQQVVGLAVERAKAAEAMLLKSSATAK
jgi:hypothetical protein